MVFYRNGTLPGKCFAPEFEPCFDWVNEVPQGFSCGVGIHKEGCWFDQYEFVDCSEVAVKVADVCCPGWCQDDCPDDCFAWPFTGYAYNPCT